MNQTDFEAVVELSLQRRKALIEMLTAEENFLLAHGRIKRRACVSKSSLKKGAGRTAVLPQGATRRK